MQSLKWQSGRGGECSWWKVYPRERPGVGMKSHILGVMRNLLTSTEEKSREEWPSVSLPSTSTFPKTRDVRQRPNFWCPSLMSCPENGSPTGEEPSPHEINMKYNQSHGEDALMITGWLWAAQCKGLWSQMVSAVHTCPRNKGRQSFLPNKRT